MNIRNENGYLPGSYFDAEVKRLERQPVYALKNIIKALKMHYWLNNEYCRIPHQFNQFLQQQIKKIL